MRIIATIKDNINNKSFDKGYLIGGVITATVSSFLWSCYLTKVKKEHEQELEEFGCEMISKGYEAGLTEKTLNDILKDTYIVKLQDDNVCLRTKISELKKEKES